MTNERYLAILAIILASVVLISSSLTVDASDSIEKDNGCSTVGNVTLFSNDSVNIKKITDEIKLLAATSLAESVLPSELEENYIIPDALDKDVAKNISACIINHVRKS